MTPPFTDKMIHTIQFFGLLATATLLIIFGHNYIQPEIVFTSMIAGLSGVVGSRIASNGYVAHPASDAATPPQTGESHVDSTANP